nr:hypothetical protein [Candidatus Sigynarchaeota archaeon]
MPKILNCKTCNVEPMLAQIIQDDIKVQDALFVACEQCVKIHERHVNLREKLIKARERNPAVFYGGHRKAAKAAARVRKLRKLCNWPALVELALQDEAVD